MKLSLILCTAAFLISGAYAIPGLEYEPPLKKQRLNGEGFTSDFPSPSRGSVINDLGEGNSSQTTVLQFEDADIAEEMNAITRFRVGAEIGRLLLQRPARELPQLNSLTREAFEALIKITIESLKNQSPDEPFQGILQNFTRR